MNSFKTSLVENSSDTMIVEILFIPTPKTVYHIEESCAIITK